jgi:hypothetical protein
MRCGPLCAVGPPAGAAGARAGRIDPLQEHAMSDENALRAELEKLKAENEALKQSKKPGAISFKVSQKGAVSLYGLGRFPVTLYKEQWLRLLDVSDDIRAFMEDHKDGLKTKDQLAAEQAEKAKAEG